MLLGRQWVRLIQNCNYVGYVQISLVTSASTSVAASNDGSSDLLQNLLGMSDAATIEHMLDSAVDGAAERLAAGSQLQQPVVATEMESASSSV
jgi:hypothetical protein